MSDIIAAVGGPKIVNINGTDRTFKELSLYDKAALLKRVKAAQKAAVLADLTEAGVTDAETRYGTINDITNKKFGESDWIDLANDREGGQIMILEASLAKPTPAKRRRSSASWWSAITSNWSRTWRA